MDSSQIKSIVEQIPVLKFKFLGCFAADVVPYPFPENSFAIINNERANQSGSHWILIARKKKYYYADSEGQPMKFYKNILFPHTCVQLIFRSMQTENLCALYSIYFAYVLFSNSNLFCVDDNKIMRFFAKYL